MIPRTTSTTRRRTVGLLRRLRPRRRAVAGARRRADQRGFTMVELLVTLAVTTIGMVGLVSLNLTTMGGNGMAGRNVEATAVAQDTLESLRGMPVVDMLTAVGTPIGAPTIMDTVAGRAGVTFNRTATVTQLAASTDLLLIRVDVDWADDGVASIQTSHRVSVELVRTREEPL
ncbi:MAG: prepilin-type N-terminal cleavage/methylation domain-containing protein [Kofleriaceae bacterium]